MVIDRRGMLRLLSAGAATGAMPALLTREARAATDLRIAMVVKVLGIGYFDVCRDGGQEAAKELGGIEVIYTGPTRPTVEDQIQVIDSLIAQHVDALVISANDASALVPTTRKAARRGIKVLSFDSGIVQDGRIMHVNAPHDDLIGAGNVRNIARTLNYEGEVAILSATSQATNQNLWIVKMKEEWKKPEYDRMKLVSIVYGDDVLDKSYREAQGLFKAFPNLRGIISPTAVGIVAAAKAVADAGLTGKVFVTGHGLPSEMRPAVLSGVTQTFQLWNPADLGYAGVTFAAMIVRGQATGAVGSTTRIGRLGDMTIEPDGNTYLKELLVFDKSNIDKYAKLF